VSLTFVVIPFLLFTLLALRQPGQILWSLPGESASLLTGLSVVLWNYTGWDNISLVGDEVENPQRSYPIALFAALALIVAMYAGPVLAGLRVAPHPEAWTEGAFPTFAGALPNAGWLSGWLLAGALVSTFTLFNSLLLSYSRLPMVVAADGLLPGWLARVDARGVPAESVIASAVVYSVLAAFGFSKLVVMYVLLYTLSIILEFLSLWRLRRLEPGLPRPFRIGWGNWGLGLVTVPSLAIAVAVVAYVFWDNRGNLAWLIGAGAASVAGMPLYWVLKKKRA
jgi:amino acid transporter